MVRVIYDYVELLEVPNLSSSTSTRTRTGLRLRQRHECGGGLGEPKSGSQSNQLWIEIKLIGD